MMIVSTLIICLARSHPTRQTRPTVFLSEIESERLLCWELGVLTNSVDLQFKLIDIHASKILKQNTLHSLYKVLGDL